ncbi:MAG: DNA methyltransferase [Thiofilum sp.]|uniref:class I SAM-dependent DNA methyltransferase n=1 Tax=Thiofilum sp. TaxID=2212733 RepID=UPI0025ECE7B6|nr:DNA methyltransferase [Thiofilum sp.]MBK8454755.1 class I SAM-dependent DNA methyltransferase [Thiofilum sp.]
MNAVEIEEAISRLAEQAFEAKSFPYAFLEAFGNKPTTIKRLQSGATNTSDIVDGVLQRNNIHLAVCALGEVTATLNALRHSPATHKAKVKFILATDGQSFEAEDLSSGETVACAYADFPNHFGFFLPLAGITTVKQIRENTFDIRATSRLNRLYVELLSHNPEWGTSERRHDMNHFMARLIFCFFAEDTDIFHGNTLFTATIEQMSAPDSSNTHEVISEIFRAMNTKIIDRQPAKIRSWADGFPYVNGGLFSGSTEVPRFTKIARSYLLHVGNLDWKQINPDIFGSMIQAVADDEERGALGMHYTSVPNILKVLNPLFLDDLREQLAQAENNPRKLLNLRKRIANIRVFDPACGSGNFLVIAYKQMREIEAQINERRGERGRSSDISLRSFRGIELRDFPAEIARLALIIAEYQCDVLYQGQKEALATFLPLDAENWIICGNALRLDWLSVCPPTGTGVKLIADDLFSTPLQQAEIDFENAGGETYICGNPPYKGNADQNKTQKADMKDCLSHVFPKWKSLDYICAWFYLAQRFSLQTNARYALVSTNSICQGQNIANFWFEMNKLGTVIKFAVLPFKWNNLAAHNAGVTVSIIGGGAREKPPFYLFQDNEKRTVQYINSYLVEGEDVWVNRTTASISCVDEMLKGNYYGLSEGLLLSKSDMEALSKSGVLNQNLRFFKESDEIIKGKTRYCLWFTDEKDLQKYSGNDVVRKRINSVRESRLSSPDPMAIKMAETPHQFREMRSCIRHTVAIPVVSSENREYLPVTLENQNVVFSNAAFALYDVALWNMAILCSKLHITWIRTVCGQLETRLRYSNLLGWNTFPVPKLTEKNKEDLTRCAENILLAREAHFPATIADLYDPETMPDNLRQAHERNDEVLERIYIGRRFKNDTERLEKLFELYTKMTSNANKKAASA